MDIKAGVAHTTLTQVFVNPNSWQAEGIYLFPLPKGAAVTEFQLTMDGVPVSGEVLDRQKAASIYLGIVRKIRDPALLEYLGNRVFRARIFPFEPKGERTLTLSYAQVLPREGDYHVFRYLSGRGTSDGTVNRLYQISRHRYQQDPRSDYMRRMSQFVLEGTIEDERPLGSVYSPTHPLAVDKSDPDCVRFSAEGDMDTRNGFTLFYSLAEDEIGLSLLRHRPEGSDGYFLLTISPGCNKEIKRIPRDLIFILDISGSMVGGGKLEQAVEALKFGLGTLEENDRFALLTYNSTIQEWGDGLMTAAPETVEEALEHVEQFQAAGGTNIEGALIQAADLAGQAVSNRPDGNNGHGNGHDRPLYIVFLTDGCPTVGNSDPDALIALSKSKVEHSARLFTWGVGYDVNAYLLDRLAQNHDGSSAYVQPYESLEIKVSAFFNRISSPVLTDIEYRFEGIEIFDIYPERLSDLFRGSDITVMGRYRGSGEGLIQLSGSQDGRALGISRPTDFPLIEEKRDFLAPLWAQRKVGYLLEQIRLNGESEELRNEITMLGEKFGLVTPYTSYLVAESQYIVSSWAGDLPQYADRNLHNVHYRVHIPGVTGIDSTILNIGGTITVFAERDKIVRDVAATQQSYSVEEMERMAVSTTADILALQTNRYALQDSTYYTGQAGNRQQVGRGAVQSSLSEKDFQSATTVLGLESLTVKRVGEKTFHLNTISGVWRDEALEEEMEFAEVEVGSEAFMQLLDRHEDLARYAALGVKVEVLLGKEAYRIIVPEMP